MKLTLKHTLQSSLYAAAVATVPIFCSFLIASTIAVGQSKLPLCPNNVPESSWDNCQGAMPFPNGNKYVGDFKDGKFNGQGAITFADATKYVGGFKNNKFNGQGTFTRPDGTEYVGDFKDGKFNGQGTETLGKVGKYVGEFKDNTFNGRGTLTTANGNKYVGEFKDDKFNGQGTATYANGQKYVGEFKDSKYNGEGTAYEADGLVISSGLWADNKFVGTVADQETIRMERNGGVYVVPVRFNDIITLDAVVDSGASDVSIPADIVLTLMRTKTVTEEDFLGKQTYVLADGSKVPSQQFRIRSLRVGNKTVRNVVASIASVNATILLGQSFLSKFKSWSVDNERHVLILRQGTEVSVKSGEPATPTPQKLEPRYSGYSVQVSSQRSRADALAAYQILQNKFPSILSGRKPIIHRVELGGHGVFYRAHVGPFRTAEEADELCRSLRAAGGMCIVQSQ